MLTHLDTHNFPQMVDISNKKFCTRSAVAQAVIELHEDIVQLFADGDIRAPKGAVFHTAIMAGIQAVKETSRLVPLCHPIPITGCNVQMDLKNSSVVIVCSVTSNYATGVEMEAIVGATHSAITVYDMCKGINSDMIINDIKLIEKKKEPLVR